MPKSLARKMKHEMEDTIEDIATTLRKAADDLSDDAEQAVAQAAVALRQAAQALADKTPAEAKALSRKAVAEVKAHPIASTAAALSAAAALITLLGVRRKRPS